MKPIIDDLITDIYNLKHKILHSRQIIIDWQSNDEVVEDQKVLIKEYKKAIREKQREIIKLKIISIFK